MNGIKEKFNHSGFHDDDSYTSSEQAKNRITKNHFLANSHLDDSLKKYNKNNNSNSNSNLNQNSNNDIRRAISSDNNNENIIEINTEKNEKVSINSEEENNLLIKNKLNENNNNIQQEKNDLNENLLLNPPVEEDNLMNNITNMFSKASTTDEMLRDTIKIPLNYKNRTNKFNTSRLARTFIYEDRDGNKKYLLKSRKFGIAESRNVITYILNLYIFSEFANFNDLEKDNRFNLIFIPSTDNKFEPNTEKVLNKLNMNVKNNSDQFTQFINGMNDLLDDQEYKDIQKKNTKSKVCLIILNIFLFLLIAGMSFSFYYFFDIIFQMEFKIKLAILIIAGVICLILIIILIFQIKRLCRIGLYKRYNNLNYMLINYSRFNDYIEEWNKNYFEMYKIRATIPISLNYIMFNLEPHQDIEIKHLNMRWFIEKLYKGKSMANDKEFIKFFIKVRSTLDQDTNYYDQ